MTKNEIIDILKTEYPTLSYGINDEVFEMSDQQYEETINSWADVRLAKLAKGNQAIENKAKRLALLEKLGISEAEAETLLS